MSKIFTQSDVAAHSKPDSLWIVIDGDVYDLTKFQDEHPGASGCAGSFTAAGVSFRFQLLKHKLTWMQSHRWQKDPPEGCRQGCL
jgi:Cytochrome b involved in lipid metabolism